MKVLKFGGTSVGSASAIEAVGKIIAEQVASGPIVVVVSAQSGVTNRLHEAALLATTNLSRSLSIVNEIQDRLCALVQELIPPARRARTLAAVRATLLGLQSNLEAVTNLGELSPRSLDLIMSVGELISCEIVTAYCNQALGKVNGEFIDSRSLIATDTTFGNAKVIEDTTYQQCRSVLLPLLNQNLGEESGSARIELLKAPIVPIVPGFIAKGADGSTTTLGRGGSDLTASLIAAALQVQLLEIWTDVDGVLTADPRKVPKVFPLPHISYEEALELSHFGAKVIYAPTMRPVMAKGIPLAIRNTFNAAAAGTVVGFSPQSSDYQNTDDQNGDRNPSFAITGISSIDSVAVIRIQGNGLIGISGVAARVFQALAKASVNVILITQASSETNICIAVLPGDALRASEALSLEFHFEMGAGLVDPPVLERSLAIVSIVGAAMCRRPGIAGSFFASLGRNGINIIAIAQGSSELSISVVIDRNDEEKALRAIHDEFFTERTTRTLNLAVVGTGLVGKTLLHQIASHHLDLKQTAHLEIRVVGIARSKRGCIVGDGIDPSAWQQTLDAEGEPYSIEQFISKLSSLNLPNCIFVDCTSSDSVAAQYPRLMEHHIAVVTPNKRGQSGTYREYAHLKESSRRYGVPFLFETSVGAGLPVIGTLHDLLKSGDRIRRIEGVLSGTLGFICGELTRGTPYSEAVRTARSRGYTEPDPRDDLCGMDVARKILILARESGYKLELADISVESLVPKICQSANSADQFLEMLPKGDEQMKARSEEARQMGGTLAYVASFTPDEGAKTRLTVIKPDHPFSHLKGADNIISFTTDRYSERPLVVQGPGAGAEVTAAGVFADIVRIAQVGIAQVRISQAGALRKG